MSWLNKNIEIKETQNDKFEFFPYTNIYWNESLIRLSLYYNKIFNHYNLDRKVLVSIIEKALEEKWLTESNILATKYENKNVYIYLDNGANFKISINEIKKISVSSILWTSKKQDIEAKIDNLNKAIEHIYSENEWIIFNDEINNEDIVETYEFWKENKWKTLLSLKKELDIENKKLLKIYEITWETSKYVNLLKTELKYYAWVWDKYEWWARYFALSQEEIDIRVRKLSNKMTISEMIDYIKENNKDISDNYKKSDMVSQVNKKLMESIYKKTYERLINEEASTEDFIYFVKTITGRWELHNLRWRNAKNKKERTDFTYHDLDIDDEYKKIDMANEALIHIMYRKDWVLDNAKNIKVELEDKYVWKRSSKYVITESIIQLDSLNPGKEWYWISILSQAWYSKMLEIDKSYNDLTFDEKIKIWAIARISELVKESKNNESDINKLGEKLQNALYDSFDDLNQEFSDNFDESLFDWNWKKSADLWLSWEFAEIFDLYQDINWANWLFDWSDKNADKLMWIQTATVLWIWIIVWVIMLSPVITTMAAWGAVSWLSLFVSWATIWSATWITSSIVQTQWYDTLEEWVLDISTQIWSDAILSWLFTMAWLNILQKIWNVNPDLLLSQAAWTTLAGVADKGFILWEVAVTGMIVSPTASHIVKQYFKENHFDTDKKKN